MKRCAGWVLILFFAFCSVCAGAETIPVTVVRISDPMMVEDGEVIADMTGLTMQISSGETADGELMMLFIDLFAQGENEGSAVLQIQDEALAMYLGGMTKAYLVPAEELGTGFGNDQASLENLDDWAFYQDAQALVQEFALSELTLGREKTVQIALGDGTQEMAYTPFSGDITDLIIDLVELAEDDPIISSYLEEYEEESVSSLLRDGDFSATISGGLGATPDRSKNLIDFRIEMEAYGEETAWSGRVTFDDPTAYPCNFTWNSVSVAESSTETIRLNGYIDEFAFQVDGTIIDDDEEDAFDAQYEISFDYRSQAYTSIMPSEGFTASVTDLYTDTEFSMSVFTNLLTYETHADFSFNDQFSGVEISLAYLPDETPAAGTASSGTFDFTTDFGFFTEKLTCDVEVIETTIDTDDFYIDPATAIDVTDMSEVESNQAESELEAVLQEMLALLEEAVPGLTGLTESIFGLGYGEMF